jgi:hypothetical protein
MAGSAVREEGARARIQACNLSGVVGIEFEIEDGQILDHTFLPH